METIHKFIDVIIGDFPNGLILFAGAFFELVFAIVAIRNEVADVGHVHDAVNFVAIGNQSTYEQIPINIRGKITDVWRTVDSWSAGVNLDDSVRNRFEGFEFFAGCIIEFH